MTDAPEAAPAIACTLAEGDFKARLAWIADLNAVALREARCEDLRLELAYALQTRDLVRELVRREQACCAFLTFAVREDASAIWLVIEAPEVAREAAELVFAPFRAKSPIESKSRGA